MTCSFARARIGGAEDDEAAPPEPDRAGQDFADRASAHEPD